MLANHGLDRSGIRFCAAPDEVMVRAYVGSFNCGEGRQKRCAGDGKGAWWSGQYETIIRVEKHGESRPRHVTTASLARRTLRGRGDGMRQFVPRKLQSEILSRGKRMRCSKRPSALGRVCGRCSTCVVLEPIVLSSLGSRAA